MSRIQVEMPDGTIIDAPEGVTKAQIESKYKPQAQPKVQSPLEAGVISAANAIPFMGDIQGAGYALTNPQEGVSFNERRAQGKEVFDALAQQAMQDYPKSAITGTVASGITQGALIPVKALQGATVAMRALKGAGVGGALGTLYGLGQGEGDERLSNAFSTGVFGTIGGSGGSLAVDAISAGVRPLASRAAALVNKVRSRGKTPSMGIEVTAPNVISDIQDALKQNVDTSLTGEGIPLTRGQLTQDPKLQSLEYGASAGIYGDDAQKMMNEARQLQSQAAVKELAPARQVPDTIESLTQNLKQSYASAKAKTNLAYNKLGQLTQDDPLKIGADYIKDGVIPSFKDWTRKGTNGLPFDLSADGMGEAKRLYNQAVDFEKIKNVSSVNLTRMENWRSKVSQRIARSQDPQEKLYLNGLMSRYDTAMNNLPKEAIKSGDIEIIDALEKARYARKEQGTLFERSKFVKDVLSNESLTPEQFGNSLTSLGTKSGAYVRDVLRTAGKDEVKKTALRQDMRDALMGSVVSKSLGNELAQGSTPQNIEQMISFDKLATNMDKMLDNKTLMKQLFDEGEWLKLQNLNKQIKMIKSVKAGSKNYSNTAYTLLNVLNNVSPALTRTSLPLVGSLGGGVETIAKAGATQELTQSLAPVLKNINEISTNSFIDYGAKYGRNTFLGATVSSNIQDAPLTTDLKVTVRPSDKR